MNKADLITKLSGTFSKAKLGLKKHSPEILIVSGIVGTVVSTVMICKSTTKANDILDEAKERLDDIHTVANDESKSDLYSEDDKRKDLTIVYVQTGVKMVKLYLPWVVLGGLSVASILASNNIMRKRNAAIAAAYATVDRGFKEYRNRVVDRFGEEVEKELYHDTKAEKMDEYYTDEDGKTKKKKVTEQVTKGGLGPYSFLFDESSTYWKRNGDYNRMFLLSTQQYMNDKLRINGYLFLNDVLEALDIPRTAEQLKMGQIVGWTYDTNNPKGDNYVDFGIYEAFRRDEIDADEEKALGHYVSRDKYSRSLILDFNVDGNVLDLL